jgi:hypothetical protein
MAFPQRRPFFVGYRLNNKRKAAFLGSAIESFNSIYGVSFTKPTYTFFNENSVCSSSSPGCVDSVGEK